MNPFDAELTRIEGAHTDGLRGRPNPRRGNRGIPIPQGLSPTPAQQGPISQSPEILGLYSYSSFLSRYFLKLFSNVFSFGGQQFKEST